MKKTRLLIMGAAGRDFHNFNVCYRQNESIDVVAFTATQIPHIEERMYPKELSGPQYPKGIPIYPESRLVSLIKEHHIEQVVFSYSDVGYDYVMHQASVVNSAGADFILLGAERTMLASKAPVIAVCAVRTGCGKSQTTRKVCETLRDAGKKVVAIRHPMPYGNLAAQKVQRFASYSDLDLHQCTIEEREEYEPHIDMGNVIYAGVDYEAILREAEKEADIIVWDGGNNDTSFYRPDFLITVVDPHRAGHELSFYPGETNFRMADVIVMNKMDTAPREGVDQLRANIRAINPNATVIEANSPIHVDDESLIRGKKVLVIEDGPTLTHGGMTYGAGIVASRQFHAAEIIDPRPWVVGEIEETYRKYPKIGPLLPAMGYGDRQIADLKKTIDKVDCDTVVIGTPIDLSRVLEISKPSVRVQYKLQEIGDVTIKDVLKKFL